MANAYARTRPQSYPARLLLSLATAGPAGLTASEYQRLGIALFGGKASQLAAANQLTSNNFVERRVVLTDAGLAEVARLRALDDSALDERPLP